MRKILLLLLILITVSSFIFSTTTKAVHDMTINFDLSDIASKATYKFTYYEDANFAKELEALRLTEDMSQLSNQKIYASGTMYLKWNVISPYSCSIVISSTGPLYGKDGRAGEEYISLQATISGNNTPAVNSVTWGSLEPFIESEEARSKYTTKIKIADLDLSKTNKEANGSAKIEFKTGNAFSQAPQEYVCNIKFEIIQK